MISTLEYISFCNTGLNGKIAVILVGGDSVYCQPLLNFFFLKYCKGSSKCCKTKYCRLNLPSTLPQPYRSGQTQDGEWMNVHLLPASILVQYHFSFPPHLDRVNLNDNYWMDNYYMHAENIELVFITRGQHNFQLLKAQVLRTSFSFCGWLWNLDKNSSSTMSSTLLLLYWSWVLRKS